MGLGAVRYIICILGSIGLGIVYGLKVNFHVAIVSMINYTAVGVSGEHDDIGEDGPFVWSKSVQGLLLSSYFWGYMVSELPGGRIADALSAKWLMFFAISINVVGALVTPFFAEVHWGLLLVVRVLQGIGGGVTFPGMHVILAHWAPPNERSVMSNIVYAGTALGTVTFMLLTGLIASHIGWDMAFYIEGGVSALWLLLWAFLVSDDPSNHKFISEEEKDFINKSLNTEGGHHGAKMPWKAAMTSKPFLAILVAHICSNWGWYMVLVELPLFMKSVLKFKMKENAFLTALPFLTMWIFSMILSKLLDFLRSKELITTTTARKVATGIASLVPLVCFIALCFIQSQTGGVILMTLAITGVGGMFCGFLSNHIDIAPNFAGTLVAVTNTFATIPGIAVPIVVSALTDNDPGITSWRIIFVITVVLYVVEFLAFTIFGSGEEQPWNNKEEGATSGETVPLNATKTSDGHKV